MLVYALISSGGAVSIVTPKLKVSWIMFGIDLVSFVASAPWSFSIKQSL